MKPTRLLSATTLALLALCGTTLARDTVKLKNGDRLKGQATAYNDQTRILSFQLESGEAREIPVDDLDGRSYYQVIRSQVPKDNARGQLQLANFARDVGLYAHSVRHYDYALKADAALKTEIDADLAILRREAGAWAMGIVRDALQKGDRAKAERWLKKIVRKLPNEPVAREAEATLERYHAETQAAKDDELERKHAEKLKKELKTAKKHYDDMMEGNIKALTNTGSGNKAVKAWEDAIRDGERAQKELDKFLKKHADEGDVIEAVGGYTKIIDDQLIDMHLSLASHWSTRSSYNKAQREVNLALAIDPKNKEARSMRARIEEAASRGIDWGWGWGGSNDRPRDRDQ